MRAVSKGVVHKNTGSRKVSRLAARLKKLAGSPERRRRRLISLHFPLGLSADTAPSGAVARWSRPRRRDRCDIMLSERTPHGRLSLAPKEACASQRKYQLSARRIPLTRPGRRATCCGRTSVFHLITDETGRRPECSARRIRDCAALEYGPRVRGGLADCDAMQGRGLATMSMSDGGLAGRRLASAPGGGLGQGVRGSEGASWARPPSAPGWPRRRCARRPTARWCW